MDKPVFIRVTALESGYENDDETVECKYWLRLERITYLEEIDDQNTPPPAYVGARTYIMYIDGDPGDEGDAPKTLDFYVKESAAELMGRLRDYGVIAIG